MNNDRNRQKDMNVNRIEQKKMMKNGRTKGWFGRWGHVWMMATMVWMMATQGVMAVEITEVFDVAKHTTIAADGGSVTVTSIPLGIAEVSFGPRYASEADITKVNDNQTAEDYNFTQRIYYGYNAGRCRNANTNANELSTEDRAKSTTPAYGCFLKITPRFDGTIKIPFYIQQTNNRTLWVKEGSNVSEVGTGQYFLTTSTISVSAGKTYYFFDNDNATPQFYGFIFTYDRTEWIFNDAEYWRTTDSELSSANLVGSSGPDSKGYRYDTTISNAALHFDKTNGSSTALIPETNGLTFTTTNKARLALSQDNTYVALSAESKVLIPVSPYQKVVISLTNPDVGNKSIGTANCVNFDGNAASIDDLGKYETREFSVYAPSGGSSVTIESTTNWVKINYIKLYDPPTLDTSASSITYGSVSAGDATVAPSFTLKASDGTVLTQDDFTISYSSSNTGAATVNSDGLLTGVDVGTTTITAKLTSKYGWKCQATNVEFKTTVTVTNTFEWSASEVTIDIADLNNDNKTDALPTLSTGNRTVKITSTNTSVATFWGSETSPRIHGVGTTTIRATNTANSGDFQEYTLTVTGDAATASSTTFSTTQSYDEWKLTDAGTWTVPATIALDNITLSFGYTGETAVIVNNPTYGLLTQIIDGNGFSHANVNSNTLHEDGAGGTFCKFVTKAKGKLEVTGRIANVAVLTALTTSSTYTTDPTKSADGKTLTLDNLPAGTYYLYSTEGSVGAFLGAFRFTLPSQDLTIAATAVSTTFTTDGATIDTQTVTNSSSGGATVTYASSDASVAEVDASGHLTIHKGGHAVITATADAVAGKYAKTVIRYPVDVNVDKKWVFDDDKNIANNDASSKSSLTSAGLTLEQPSGKESRWAFKSGEYVMQGIECKITIPGLTKGQLVEILATAGHSNTIKFTNALDIITHTDAGPATVNTAGLHTIQVYVKEDGNFIFEGDTGNGDTYIRAIYVYTPNETRNTMTFNAGVTLYAESGKTGLSSLGDYIAKVEDAGGGSTRQRRALVDSSPLPPSIFGRPTEFTSSTTSVATIDAETGILTPLTAGTTTITAHAYPTKEYATTYARATLTADVTVKATGAAAGKTIEVEQLMYTPMASSTDQGLDRTIPNFELTLTGDNLLTSSADGSALVINGGNIHIVPRYADSHSKDVYIKNAVVYYTDGTSEKFTTAADQQYIDITQRNKSISYIYVEYQSSDGSTTVADLLNSTPVTPYLAYAHSSMLVEKGYTIDYILPTVRVNNSSGALIKNLRGMTYSLSEGGHVTTTADGKQLKAESAGSETLTASFAHGSSAYFADPDSESPSPTCTVTVVSKTDKTPTVTFDDKLYLDASALYPNATIDGFVFAGEAHTPTPAITGTGADLSNYTVTYTSSDNSIAYPSSDGTKIYAAQRQGLATITATFTPADPGTTPVLTAQYHLYVLSGKWDFTTINNTTTESMKNTPWSKSTSTNGSNRDTENFEPFLKDNQDALDQTIGLLSAYHVRLYNSGAVHLYGCKDDLYRETNGSVGGTLRVPVREGMSVTITAYNNTGDGVEISLDGLDDLNGNAVTTFSVGTTSDDYTFIANRDGYADIINSTTNVNLFIQRIKVFNEILFHDGKEVYIKAGAGTYVNPVLNQGESVISYTYKNALSAQATAIDATSGVVTFGSGYGQFQVEASAAGGELNGQTSTYTATLLEVTHSDTETTITPSGITQLADVATLLTINTGTIFDSDKTAKEAAIKSKFTYSIDEATTTAKATLDGTSLTIEGAGKVCIIASLSTISETIIYTVTGGALNVPNPVIANDAKSYTIRITGAGDTHKFMVKQMYNAIIGDLKAAPSLSFYTGDHVKIADPATTTEITSDTLRIEGFSNKGGVIPIFASYVYNGTTYQLEGTLTVAYTSHVWNFEHNLISGDNSAEGVAAGIHTGLAHWYSATGQREGKWTTTATFDMPTDAGDAIWATEVDESHTDSHDWRFVRKMKDLHRESAIIYYYNHNVQGQNALVIPETQGLVMQSTKSGQQLGVEMNSERVMRTGYGAKWGKPIVYTKGGTSGTDPGYTYTAVNDSSDILVNGDLVNGGNAFLNENKDKAYYASSIMLLNGGRITIPKLKQGQWVEVRWTRHQDDLGERILMENLSDVEGTPITSTYKIGNTFYNLDWSTSTYMFQATKDGDVTFTVSDNVYVSIQQIELHEPGWNYQSSIVSTLAGFVNDIDTDGAGKLYTDDKYKDSNGKLAWGTLTRDTAPKVKWQYVWDDQGEHTVTILPKSLQNAPNAPQTWTFEMDEMLTRSGAEMVTDGQMDQAASLTYKGGWGKVKVTMTCYSQNMKYVANKKQWTITFGQAPKQTYPYTWDFSKYFDFTKTNIGTDTWSTTGEVKTVVYTNYDTQNYTQSYYVEGAQLVSYALRGTNNGVLRETDGLGFKLDTSNPADATPDASLSIDMTHTVNAATQATPSTVTADGVRTAGQTWRDTSSHLSLGSGGSIIVPKPNDDTGYANYYIYIHSSAKPTIVGESAAEDDDASLADDVCKYHFTANAHAEFKFASGADIYQIAVTPMQKRMAKVGDKGGWATESRERNIDYTLTHLFTQNDVEALAAELNTAKSETGTRAVVTLKERYVVPHSQVTDDDSQVKGIGLVLRQTSGVTADYDVPLFVPAVTTAADPLSNFEGNLMMPNLSTRTFATEHEDADGTDNAAGDYTRFILAQRYMTWKKDGDGDVTHSGAFISGDAPVFYRMHLYDAAVDGEGYTALNTLGDHKAYLHLRHVPEALWGDESESAPGGSAPRRYLGIEGVSDMEEVDLPGEDTPSDEANDHRIYNMGGQLMGSDEHTLPPGVYIRAGKKFVVR